MFDPGINYLMSIDFTDIIETPKGKYYIECNSTLLYRCYFKTKDNKVKILKDLKLNINEFKSE